MDGPTDHLPIPISFILVWQGYKDLQSFLSMIGIYIPFFWIPGADNILCTGGGFIRPTSFALLSSVSTSWAPSAVLWAAIFGTVSTFWITGFGTKGRDFSCPKLGTAKNLRLLADVAPLLFPHWKETGVAGVAATMVVSPVATDCVKDILCWPSDLCSVEDAESFAWADDDDDDDDDDDNGWPWDELSCSLDGEEWPVPRISSDTIW